MAGPSAFQAGEQGDQRVRRRAAILDEPGEGLIDPRLEGRVGIQPRPSRRAAVRQPLQAEEGGIGQRLGHAPGQPRLAAAQRADDVVQGPDVAQLEPLAAPGPGKVEGDAGLRGRLQQSRQLAGGRRLAPGEIVAQPADLLDGVGELADPAFERRLVRGQRRLKSLRIAAQHPRHLGEAEAERAQGDDLGGAGHLVGTVGAPSGRGADRRDEAALLVEPQGLGGDAEPPGGFGRVQELGGRGSRITSLLADRDPYRGGRRGRVKGVGVVQEARARETRATHSL